MNIEPTGRDDGNFTCNTARARRSVDVLRYCMQYDGVRDGELTQSYTSMQYTQSRNDA